MGFCQDAASLGHDFLRFDPCSPNPSALSLGMQNSGAVPFDVLHPTPQLCISCNRSFTPRGVKTVTGNATIVWMWGSARLLGPVF